MTNSIVDPRDPDYCEQCGGECSCGALLARAQTRSWQVACECSPEPFEHLGPEPVLCPRCLSSQIETEQAHGD